MKTYAISVLYTLASLLAFSVASFDGNINYGSPSPRHTQFGIDLEQVQRRSWKRGNIAFKPEQLNFTHGVASGDPWPHSVILWTRIAPTNVSSADTAPIDGTEPLYSHETKKFIEADPNPICLHWKVFPVGKTESKSVVSSGKAYTTADIDYTVKVEAKGLKPLTTYNYQFTVCNSKVSSPLGRTKTAPRPDDDISEINLAVFSCSAYFPGYFNVYGNAARKDKHDWVVHLGDYIYEYGTYTLFKERGSIPQHPTYSLYDYRARHGQHRTDPDLQLLAQNSAWITTWDDHELADNAYRDGYVDFFDKPNTFKGEGPKVATDARKANAVRAYFEWMPIRQTDMDDGLRVWRSFQLGKLMDLVMLDTRLYDRSKGVDYVNEKYIEKISDDPSRTLMGGRQENWFYRSLSESNDRNATWRVIGNQIVFSHIKGDAAGGGDTWDGYIANRNRTLNHLYKNKIDNNIFLSGDSHMNWVSDLAWLGTKEYDPKTGKGAIGAEFAGTAASSWGTSGLKSIEPDAGKLSRKAIAENKELFWQEGYYRGYFHLSVTPKNVSAQFFGSPSIATHNAWEIPLANFTVLAGDNHIHRPKGGVQAESGALKLGKVKHTNLTLNTETGTWKVKGFGKMYLNPEPSFLGSS
ncbi:alkaline phosphatase [Fusarium tjaetaba]|uniref:Alkaline phosphatase n=1 Tax=Fusarium tjaetaba TaxID=1567544 RepID=A0A8H5SA20_9HYPO|nr:alkaline phosphatase [Fusarium tjaetaba]KAF5649089.1 alkaline phosphatase [Fusarium tjaetaba]